LNPKELLGEEVAAGLGDFRLGEWLVQPQRDRLVHGRTEVHVRPKLMDLLVFLAQHAGQVVSKEDTLTGVWAKPFMGESVLSGLVAELRAIFNDDARRPRFIETVPKRGYRLVAPVDPEDDDTADAADIACVLLVGGRRIPLGEGTHIIGRAPDVAVRIDSTEISRHHAQIVVHEGRAMIEDLGSKNGTFVAKDRVAEPRVLRDGDQLRVGGMLIVFRLPRCARSTATIEDG
jgi:DNA-binding winged helix-turn-helix (wHTH) protein